MPFFTTDFHYIPSMVFEELRRCTDYQFKNANGDMQNTDAAIFWKEEPGENNERFYVFNEQGIERLKEHIKNGIMEKVYSELAINLNIEKEKHGD